MRDSDVDLYTFERLRDEFGSFTAGDSDGLGRAQRELIGSRYREILRELTAIVNYQWKEHMERSALKGFLFHGGVGVGKTATAKRHNLLPPPGVHRHRRPGSGGELLDLRDYLPGDPPKTIAWKVSARRDKLITREYERDRKSVV